ncbi:MAG TPA: amidase family protein, partial [Rhabdaerophilum sp.]|nr:amidase family protein [Rhabdaerophilum sp.]
IMANEEPLPLAGMPLAGLRIGVPRGVLFEDVESAVASAFEAGLAALSKAGARIVEMEIDDLIRDMRAVLAPAPIAACEAAEIHRDYLETRAGDFDRRVLARIKPGASVPAPAYIRALRQRDVLKLAFAARIAPFDALAWPTAPIVAPEIAPLEADDAVFAATNMLTLRNTNPCNFFDVPALSLPLPVNGLPVGFMLVSAPGSDRRLFSLGAAAEAAFAA